MDDEATLCVRNESQCSPTTSLPYVGSAPREYLFKIARVRIDTCVRACIQNMRDQCRFIQFESHQVNDSHTTGNCTIYHTLQCNVTTITPDLSHKLLLYDRLDTKDHVIPRGAFPDASLTEQLQRVRGDHDIAEYAVSQSICNSTEDHATLGVLAAAWWEWCLDAAGPSDSITPCSERCQAPQNSAISPATGLERLRPGDDDTFLSYEDGRTWCFCGAATVEPSPPPPLPSASTGAGGRQLSAIDPTLWDYVQIHMPHASTEARVEAALRSIRLEGMRRKCDGIFKASLDVCAALEVHEQYVDTGTLPTSAELPTFSSLGAAHLHTALLWNNLESPRMACCAPCEVGYPTRGDGDGRPQSVECPGFFADVGTRVNRLRGRQWDPVESRRTTRFPDVAHRRAHADSEEVPLETMPITYEEIMKSTGEHMDKVCCVEAQTAEARLMIGGEEHCDRTHCFDQMKHDGVAKMGRRLRYERRHGVRQNGTSDDGTGNRAWSRHQSQRMPGPSQISPDPKHALQPHAQVAIDLINDHSHPIDGCKHVFTQPEKMTGALSQAECIVRGIAHRISEYHGVEPKRVNEAFNAMGKTATEVFASFASMGMHSPTNGERPSEAWQRAMSNVRERQALNSKRNLEEMLTEMRREEQMDEEDEEDEPRRRLSEVDGTTLVAMTEEEASVIEVEPTRSVRISPNGEHIDLTPTINQMNRAASWRGGMVAAEAGLGRVAKKSSSRVMQQRARSGTLEADASIDHPFMDMATHAETLASLVATGQGSATRQAMNVMKAGTRSLGHVRIISDAIHLAQQESHRRRRALSHETQKLHSIIDHIEEDARWKMTSLDPHMARRLEQVRRAMLENATHADLIAKSYHRSLKRFSAEYVDRAEREHLALGDKVNIPRGRARSSLHDRIVHGIDWSGVVSGMRATIEAEHARMEWWAAGAEGEPPPIVRDSLIGKSVGANVPPSVFGRTLRSIGYAIRNGGEPPPWERDARLHGATRYHRRLDASVASSSPFHARSPFDGRNRGGHARELFETFGTGMFKNYLAVPRSDALHRIHGKAAGVIEGFVSYGVYNVLLCYMFQPELNPRLSSEATGERTFKDGTKVDEHRSHHLCFPGIPFALPNLGTFTETFNIDAHAIQNTSIEDYCGTMTIDRAMHSTVVSFAKGLGMPNNSIASKSMLRMFQNPVGAVSSLRNLVHAFGATDMTARTIHAACSIARLNAVLWTMSYLIVLSCIYLACCWPCTNIVTLLFRFCCCCLFPGHFCKKKRSFKKKRRKWVGGLPELSESVGSSRYTRVGEHGRTGSRRESGHAAGVGHKGRGGDV